MEITTLFTEQRWNIIQLLSKESMSPLQMASKANTTIANISQQLKLLEAAQLVKKVKIRNRDKGKPRTLFSLSNDYVYLVSSMHDFAEKRLVTLTDYNKTLIRIMFIEDPSLQYQLVKFYWQIEPMIKDIDALVVQKSHPDSKLYIVSEKHKEIEKRTTVQHSNKTDLGQKGLKVIFCSKNDFLRLVYGKKEGRQDRDILFIHDAKSLFKELQSTEAAR